MRILGVCGARPNFIKIDPIFRALQRDPETFTTRLVHTGQHYDELMSRVFFDELGIRRPDINLEVGSGTHAQQTAAVMVGIERLLIDTPADLVLVVGDVNSTLAATLAASKLGIPVAHVEAGLRSFDRSMPEETNRIVTDALSELLLTPSRDADANLKREGIAPERIHFVGNVMIDTLRRCRELAEARPVLDELQLERDGYALLTLHRPGNVDDPTVFAELFDALEHVQQRLPVVFPVHPRTSAKIEQHGLRDRIEAMTNLKRVSPLGYLDFLALEANAKLVLTDSGGIQEETTALGVACLTLRRNTERPVTVTEGTNRLVGNDSRLIIEAVDAILDGHMPTGRNPEFWDGHAAERIADVLRDVAGVTPARRKAA